MSPAPSPTSKTTVGPRSRDRGGRGPAGDAIALLRDLEERARNRRLRLTVRDDLTGARGPYERAGYRPMEPFSDSPDADHFLAKDL